MTTALFVFDPGGITGSAYRHAAGTIAMHEHPFEEFPPFAEWAMDLHQRHYPETPLIVVGERFDITQETIRKSRTGSLQAIETIGVMRREARRRGFPFMLQGRDRRKLVTDEFLKGCGLWHVGGGGHARDAARHLVAWMKANDKPGFADLARRVSNAT